VGGDIPDAHAAGVEVEHPLVQASQAGLALGHELWLKAPVAVTRGLDPDRAELCPDRLRGRPVADVARARDLLRLEALERASSAPAGNNSARRSASPAGSTSRIGFFLWLVKGVLSRPARPGRSPRRPPGSAAPNQGVRPQYRSPRPHTEHRTDPCRHRLGLRPHRPPRAAAVALHGLGNAAGELLAVEGSDRWLSLAFLTAVAMALVRGDHQLFLASTNQRT
jgi:hypothetical protein